MKTQAEILHENITELSEKVDNFAETINNSIEVVSNKTEAIVGDLNQTYARLNEIDENIAHMGDNVTVDVDLDELKEYIPERTNDLVSESLTSISETLNKILEIEEQKIIDEIGPIDYYYNKFLNEDPEMANFVDSLSAYETVEDQLEYVYDCIDQNSQNFSDFIAEETAEINHDAIDNMILFGYNSDGRAQMNEMLEDTFNAGANIADNIKGSSVLDKNGNINIQKIKQIIGDMFDAEVNKLIEFNKFASALKQQLEAYDNKCQNFRKKYETGEQIEEMGKRAQCCVIVDDLLSSRLKIAILVSQHPIFFATESGNLVDNKNQINYNRNAVINNFVNGMPDSVKNGQSEIFSESLRNWLKATVAGGIMQGLWFREMPDGSRLKGHAYDTNVNFINILGLGYGADPEELGNSDSTNMGSEYSISTFLKNWGDYISNLHDKIHVPPLTLKVKNYHAYMICDADISFKIGKPVEENSGSGGESGNGSPDQDDEDESNEAGSISVQCTNRNGDTSEWSEYDEDIAGKSIPNDIDSILNGYFYDMTAKCPHEDKTIYIVKPVHSQAPFDGHSKLVSKIKNFCEKGIQKRSEYESFKNDLSGLGNPVSHSWTYTISPGYDIKIGYLIEGVEDDHEFGNTESLEAEKKDFNANDLYDSKTESKIRKSLETTLEPIIDNINEKIVDNGGNPLISMDDVLKNVNHYHYAFARCTREIKAAEKTRYYHQFIGLGYDVTEVKEDGEDKDLDENGNVKQEIKDKILSPKETSDGYAVYTAPNDLPSSYLYKDKNGNKHYIVSWSFESTDILWCTVLEKANGEKVAHEIAQTEPTSITGDSYSSFWERRQKGTYIFSNPENVSFQYKRNEDGILIYDLTLAKPIEELRTAKAYELKSQSIQVGSTIYEYKSNTFDCSVCKNCKINALLNQSISDYLDEIGFIGAYIYSEKGPEKDIKTETEQVWGGLRVWLDSKAGVEAFTIPVGGDEFCYHYYYDGNGEKVTCDCYGNPIEDGEDPTGVGHKPGCGKGFPANVKYEDHCMKMKVTLPPQVKVNVPGFPTNIYYNSPDNPNDPNGRYKPNSEVWVPVYDEQYWKHSTPKPEDITMELEVFLFND